MAIFVLGLVGCLLLVQSLTMSKLAERNIIAHEHVQDARLMFFVGAVLAGGAALSFAAMTIV
jgi:hypothetical protein